MDFWFWFWSTYPGVAAAAAVFTGRQLHRITKMSAGESAISGVGLGIAWPLGLLWVIITGLNHREEVAAAQRKAEVMDLDTAHKVIARHEAKLAADRKERNERLRRDWEKLAREALPKPERWDPYNPPRTRKITDYNN